MVKRFVSTATEPSSVSSGRDKNVNQVNQAPRPSLLEKGREGAWRDGLEPLQVTRSRSGNCP